MYHHLKDDGIFLFDVHSTYKISHVFTKQTFADAEEHLSYIWNSFAGDLPNSVEHELSFFVLDEQTGKYDRFDELHCKEPIQFNSILFGWNKLALKSLKSVQILKQKNHSQNPREYSS